MIYTKIILTTLTRSITSYRPGVSTSWSETTRFEERKCHSLSVSRERVFGERRRAPGARAAGDAAPGGEAHGSGSCRHGGPPRTGPGGGGRRASARRSGRGNW